MENELEPGGAEPRRRFRKRWVAWALLGLWAGVGLWNTTKPMPGGTNVSTGPALVPVTDVQFLYDLTRVQPQGGELIYEQRIFDEVFRIVDEARSFIVADFFLLNEHMGAAGGAHRPLSRELVQRLIARKQAVPSLSVLLITDPINDVYGGAPSPALAELRNAGVEVVVTDLEQLRDSNPAYSSLWRMLLQWWGNSASGGGTMNPFTSDGAKITLRSWFSLAELQGESPQADRRGSRRRHARGTGHLGESARCEQRAFERGVALYRCARQRHRRERDGDRALLRLARTYLCRRRRGRAIGGPARHRAVIHYRGSDPPAFDRRDQRHAQVAMR